MASIVKKELKALMEKGEGFELTEEQYKKLTHNGFPRNRNYFMNASAAAKLAQLYGFEMEIAETSVVRFKKRS